jgi:CubicO group peptidase (beta-lactamase class C family)
MFNLVAAGLAGSLTAPARAEMITVTPEGSRTERAAMAEAATAFMDRYSVPGLSVAVARAGRLVYAEAFGYADRQKVEPLSPAHRFRIASISKPITSVAIFTLIEQQRLRLTDRVFGSGAILGADFGMPPYVPYVDQITVEHLLTHTGGGWSNDNRDPMFHDPSLNHAQLIAQTIKTMPLQHAPGTNYAYSNFGYCVLGRVVEKLTGQSYAAFTRDAVLRRCGIDGMEIAGNTLAERRPGEVRYYGLPESEPYTMNVTRMDSHGGWIARPLQLVQFAMHVDGFATTPNILRPPTLRIMTSPSQANPHYAKGWNVNQYDNWWHNGSLPGTVTIMVRTHSGLCWAALTNTRRPDGDMSGDLDRLVWTMVEKVPSWNA